MLKETYNSMHKKQIHQKLAIVIHQHLFDTMYLYKIRMCITVASGAEERGGGGGARAQPGHVLIFSSFQPFRSYFHDYRDAKICDARSQILCSTTNFSNNRGIVR